MRTAVLFATILLQAAAPTMASFSFGQVITASICVGMGERFYRSNAAEVLVLTCGRDGRDIHVWKERQAFLGPSTVQC